MSDNKCKKCRKLLGNTKCICCDVCNKWLHLSCTKLTQSDFNFHVNNEMEFWRCDYCTPNICKCQLLIKNLKTH